jgi:putative flippase GtrA
MWSRLNTQFARFLIVGALAALVNFLSRIELSRFMSFRWAVVIAYLIGMLTAYLLSRFLVFAKTNRHPLAELAWFTLVNVVAVIQVWLISVGLAEYIFPALHYNYYSQEVAHIIGLGIPVITSYFGHKYFTFSKIAKIN